MVTIRYDSRRGWHDVRLGPLSAIALHPATAVLHYAQAVFEGLKAYRQPDSSVALFRPMAHAARFNRSLARMAMPELPEEMFLRAAEMIVRADIDRVPPQGGSLYLRPLAFAADAVLGASRPSTSYLFVVIASPTPARIHDPLTAISAWLTVDYVRAVPGGTGAAKASANYAGALLGMRDAEQQGCDTVVWLDALERRWVEEAGAANLFFVYGSPRPGSSRLSSPGRSCRASPATRSSGSPRR